MKTYYDTCVFEHSVNACCKDYASCLKILNPEIVTWDVCFSRYVTLSESSISELLNSIEVELTRNGITVIDVPEASVKRCQKPMRKHKKALRLMGFCGADWLHLCAASSVCVDKLVSSDEDFFDPWNKAHPSAGKKRSGVRRYIEDQVHVTVARPADF